MTYGYHKYHAKKVTVDGITFDSKKEYTRWTELKLMERSGNITELERQVEYELIPTQRIGNRVAERPAKYRADFRYKLPDGTVIVEDVKGVRTPEYILKRKLMLYVHGIRVREVI